jgi:hypothetical protein
MSIGSRIRSSSPASLTFLERFKLKFAAAADRALSGCDFGARGARRGDGGARGIEAGWLCAHRAGRRHRTSGRNDAVAQFLGAANSLAETGNADVFVGPASPGATEVRDCAASVRVLPQADLADLMPGAAHRCERRLHAAAGDCLRRACVAVPIADDQPKRIQRCAAAGVAVAAELDLRRHPAGGCSRIIARAKPRALPWRERAAS